jgi:CDP-diacylglycerol--serine O-phosphatidyltransferase
MDQPGGRHFSMIRDFHLADLFTLLNGFAGMGAILAFLRYLLTEKPAFFWLGAALLPVAFVMDALDGRIARWRQKASTMGQELDSLADVVSFGVAPAVMGFAAGMQGGWDAPFLIYFVGCGISRLARYNTTAAALSEGTGKVKYFEGLPIPSSLLLVVLLAALAWTGRWNEDLALGVVKLGPYTLHPLVLIYFFHGSAMVSKTLRIPKP